MPFPWAEYLTLAQELGRAPLPIVSEEANWRCALSRAYYAVYHQARAVATRRGRYRSPGRGNVHQALIVFYKTHPDPAWRQAGHALDDLRQRRNKADYEDTFQPPGELQRNNVLLALFAAAALEQDLAAL